MKNCKPTGGDLQTVHKITVIQQNYHFKINIPYGCDLDNMQS